MIAEVAVIRDALAAADPANAALYDTNAAAYSNRLEQLDQWVRDSVASLPAKKRVLVHVARFARVFRPRIRIHHRRERARLVIDRSGRSISR